MVLSSSALEQNAGARSTMPSDSKQVSTLDQMKGLLANGPIVIGEWHDAKIARQCVVDLLNAGCVRYLSIESPIAPDMYSKQDGRLMEEHSISYFKAVDSQQNSSLSIKSLTQTALGLSVVVYFHDMPATYGVLTSQIDPRTEGDQIQQHPYIVQATGFISESMRMPSLPKTDRNVGSLALWKRNIYSANYLKSKLGNGVRVLWGLVLLVGDGHTTCAKTHTIQALLGIPEDRVFHFRY
jgi:hypothetical protein